MSNFVSLYTGLTAIRAAQTGLDIASHNVANANTPGYTRQKVTFASRTPFESAVGPIGAGVDVGEIARVRDVFLDRRARVTLGEFSRQSEMAGLLTRTEAMMAEPDNGISLELDSVWAAFEDLAGDPASPAARIQAQTALNALSGRVRTVATGWEQLAADTATGMDATVTEVNDILTRVAVLNRQIPQGSDRGYPPNDLIDERDLLLDQLASAAGATFTAESDGTVTVTVGGVDVVNGITAEQLTSSGPPAYTLTTATGTTVTPGGTLGGTQRFLTTGLPRHQAALDDFAAELAATINGQNAAGFTYPDDAPGGALLAYDPAQGASSLQLDPTFAGDISRIATASTAPAAEHDGRNATALAGLRTQSVAGSTIADRLVGIVVALAGDVAAATTAARAEDSLRVAAESARDSVHGVSLDEELVAVVQYQRSLEAASRVMTAIDEAMDVLINRTGIVGR